MAALSEEQFKQLLETLKVGFRPASPPPVTADKTFADCKSRFAASKEECVDSFINAISLYKDCVSMSDDVAFRGLALLL